MPPLRRAVDNINEPIVVGGEDDADVVVLVTFPEVSMGTAMVAVVAELVVCPRGESAGE